jgi:heme/copper-type cytochrome/quinol oxidase subunit 3
MHVDITPFSINDGIFDSLCFMLADFYGFHVLIGSNFQGDHAVCEAAGGC